MLVPLYGGGAGDAEAVGVSLGTNCAGTVITANATPGNDGAWTQLIAATARQYHGIFLCVHHGATVGGVALIELGQGGAGSEQILATLMHWGRAANRRFGAWGQFIPLSIPGGVRLAARVRRSATASMITRVWLAGIQQPPRYGPPFHRLTDYGVDLTNKRGTTVDPGGTAGTQGTKTTIDASTTNPIQLLYIQAKRQTEAAAAADGASTIQVFVGAASSEVALTPELPSWYFNSTDDHDQHWGPIGPFFVNVPAGSRLSAAARCSNATATERESSVILWGLD